jgi:glycosyltransferase involved in cell wall biosynthesis
MVVIPNGYVDKNISIVKTDRKKIILSVGRISLQKGFDILIKSFQKVHLIHNDWQLRIVGPIVDQEYYDYLKNIVNNYNLEKSVIFVGEKMGDDLENEYNNASIFCLLSRYESFGTVRSEAIAHGLPMITSEAGCGIVYEKYGSIIVPIENTLKPAEAMKKLIENPKLREEIAKKQMNAIITFDEVAKRIDDLPKF